MFKISDWFKLIVCTILSSGIAIAGNFGRMNFAYWQTVVTTPTVTYLVVAGGGGSGSNWGGGGGAGGLVYNTSNSFLTGITYTITVGSGGSAGSTGGNSVISGTGITTITALGGGAGVSYQNAGGNGGSGGGGASYTITVSGGTATQPSSSSGGYGNNGGMGETLGTGPGVSAGGGGGAGAAGGNGQINAGDTQGNGGNGLSYSITGTSTYYAGGGGGGGYSPLSVTAGTGGLGGGGAGGYNSGQAGNAGAANTGGGAGGGGGNYGSGASGGSGVVIISVPSIFSVTTTGTVVTNTNGSNTVYSFNSSGTFVINTILSYSNYFNSGDYLTVANNSALNITGDFTWECWWYPTASGQGGGLYIKRASATYNGVMLGYLGSGTLYLYASSTGSSWDMISGQTYGTPTAFQWNHIAVSRTGSTWSCYLNGTRTLLYTAAGTLFTNTSAAYISQSVDGAYTQGYISNMRLINGTGIYSGSTITVPTAPLTAVSGTALLTCQSSTFIDNSVNSITITKYGTASIYPFAPF